MSNPLLLKIKLIRSNIPVFIFSCFNTLIAGFSRLASKLSPSLPLWRGFFPPKTWLSGPWTVFLCFRSELNFSLKLTDQLLALTLDLCTSCRNRQYRKRISSLPHAFDFDAWPGPKRLWRFLGNLSWGLEPTDGLRQMSLPSNEHWYGRSWVCDRICVFRFSWRE